VIPQEEYSLPYELKKAISPRYFNHDGSLGGSGVILTTRDMGYLAGLKDARIPGVEELMAAVEKYGKVELFFDV
jgi:hypothetical protein